MLKKSRMRRRAKNASFGVGMALVAITLLFSRPSPAADHTAAATSDFLNSIGVVSTFPDRGQPLHKTIEMVKYCGFRWVRAGIEGLSEEGPTTI